MFGFGKKEEKEKITYYKLWCEDCLTTIEIDREHMDCPDCGVKNMEVIDTRKVEV
jgi:Zn finger protein HypA/HybF involved in hydrogenase expression